MSLFSLSDFEKGFRILTGMIDRVHLAALGHSIPIFTDFSIRGAPKTKKKNFRKRIASLVAVTLFAGFGVWLKAK